jgi:hypothetical protein
MKLRYWVLLSALGFVPVSGIAAEYQGDLNAQQQYHGNGSFKDDAGNVYTGQWVDGQRHGQGVMVWSNGDRYEGEFVQDLRHGQGTFTKADGTRYSGEWEYDHLKGDVQVADRSGNITIGKVESLLFNAPSSRLVDRNVNLGPVPAKRIAGVEQSSDAAVAAAVRDMMLNPPAAGRSDVAAMQVKADAMPRFTLDKSVKELVGNAVGHVMYAVRAAQALELHVESPALGVKVSLTGYEGPGQYSTDQVKVDFSDATARYVGSQVPPAKVEVTFDDGKLIKGTLKFTALRKVGDVETTEARTAEFVLPVK